MYLNFWPASLDRFGRTGNDGSGVYSWPFPLGQLQQNARQINAVGEAAARAYIASQTVAPDMSAAFLNSTGSGDPAPGELLAVGGAGGPADFSGAPAVVALNPSAWTAPRPYMACGGSAAPGVPWNDALYSSGDSLSDSLWKHKGLLLVLAALGVAGLASARKGRK